MPSYCVIASLTRTDNILCRVPRQFTSSGDKGARGVYFSLLKRCVVGVALGKRLTL